MNQMNGFWSKPSCSDINNSFHALLDPNNVYFDTKIDILSGLEAEILAFIEIQDGRRPPS